jgi:hypothetical protein
MKKNIPGPLWIAIITLAVISLLTLLSVLQGNPLVPMVSAICNVALLVGLVLGHKWAYVLTIVFCVLGIVVGFGKGVGNGLMVLFGNGLVLVPILLCTSYFFPAPEPGGAE